MVETDYNKFRRESHRLKGWDYTAGGWYFVTICTKSFQNFFGEIAGDVMRKSQAGTLAETFWLEIPAHIKGAETDEFVVMPNHIHGILILDGAGASGSGSKSPAGHLGTAIGSYKSAVTRACHEAGLTEFAWQARYFDHIIRSDESLARIRNYISENPLKWALEKDAPDNIDF